MSDRPLRIGVWAAVSSKPQASDDKVSLNDQLASGQEFAEAVGGEVVATFSVPGHSRDLLFYHEAEATMPAYGQLRQAIESGDLDVLWCRDVDRLGRDPALAQQVISLVERNGAEVYIASAPHQLGSKTAGHRYLSAILSVRAGEEQQIRVHRRESGMRGRVKRGLFPATPPMGYEPIRDPMSGETVGYALDEHAGAVREITRLFLHGYPYAEITRRMNDNQHAPMDAERWRPGYVRAVVLNDAYAGYPSYGNIQPEEPSPHYPALWDAATYEAVLQERQRRKRGPYTRKGGSPLTGVVFCARCGTHMSRARPKGRYFYLRCNRHARKATSGVRCHANYIAEYRVIAAVTRFLDSLATPEAIADAIAASDDHPQVEQLEAEQERIASELARIDRERERLALALAGGNLDAQMYRRMDDRLLVQLEAHHDRRQQVERELASLPDPADLAEALSVAVGAFPVMLEDAEPPEVAAMLQRAGLRVECESGEIVSIRVV